MKILDFRFLTDLHVLGCLEHDFTLFTKCVCVCDTNLVTALEHKLIGRFAWSCIDWFKLILIEADCADKILVPIAQKVPLLFEIFNFL